MTAWLNDGRVQGYVLGAGAMLVWALALYVASRAPTRRASMLAALAMLCLAAYLCGEALGALYASGVERGTPAQMREMIEQSLKTWAPVVEAAKISID